MAEVKISELPPASSANPSDVFPIVQGGVTKKLPIGAITGSSTGNSVTSIKALPATPIAGSVYSVVSFYEGWAGSSEPPKGGGMFVFDAAADKALHNGVTVYAPEALAAWSGAQSDIATMLNWTGSGSGVWVRQMDGLIYQSAWGGITTGDQTAQIQHIFDVVPSGAVISFSESFSLSSTVTCNKNISIDFGTAIIDGSALPRSTVDRTLNTAFIFSGSINAPVYITSNIFAGDSSFTAAGAGLAVGDTIIVRSNQLFVDSWDGSSANKRGEMLTISEASGDTYSVAEKFRFNYLASAGLRVEKVNTISVKIKGGIIQMGGIGSDHRGIELLYTRDSSIDGLEVRGAEDSSIRVRYTHTAKINATCRDATLPLSGYGTGYGVESVDGSRNIDILITGSNCRHLVTAGGLIPSLETRVKGTAYDCGSNSTAFDCHEPCFGWTWDVECYGGWGGIGLRGSEQKVKIKAKGLGSNAVIVRTYNTTGLQYGIDVDADTDDTGASAVVVNSALQPVDGVHIKINARNTTTNGLLLLGNATNLITNIRGFADVVNSTQSSVDFRFVSGGKFSVRSRNSAIKGFNCQDSKDLIVFSDLECSNNYAIDLLRCNNMEITGLKVESSSLYGILSTNCGNIKVTACSVSSAAANGDAWRAVDTVGAKSVGVTYSCQRHAIYSSGTSNKFVVVGNDASAASSATKFNLAGASNQTAANVV